MKINAKRVNHITLAAPEGEHEKARAFYGGLLGLREIPMPDSLKGVYDLIWFELADIQIHIDFTPPWTANAQNRHFAVEVYDLSALRAHLESRGANVLSAVPIAGRERFFLFDPFGNCIEFLEIKGEGRGEGETR